MRRRIQWIIAAAFILSATWWIGWTSARAQPAKQDHWAYSPPRMPQPPAVKQASWCRNPIDNFVLAKLEQAGRAPSPQASRQMLIRRVYLDLIGLPPSPQDVREFLADQRPDAYERVVDRLLASPRYGERWARPWLDHARYADTNGYEKDNRRTNWLYRDWVINALNQDMSYREFAIEQIAGDLLPSATDAQKIATGFSRNVMTNEEGGVDKEEARWISDVDRVGVTAQAFLGATMQCAQCHDHKYDPYSQKDFYRLMAFYEHTDEPTLNVLLPATQKKLGALRADEARVKAQLNGAQFALAVPQIRWESELTGALYRPGFGQEARNLRATGLGRAAPIWNDAVTALSSAAGSAPDGIVGLVLTPRDHRTASQRTELAAYYRTIAPALATVRKELAAIEAKIQGTSAQTVSAMVMREKSDNQPARSVLRVRGAFLQRGPTLDAGVPEFLNRWPAGAPHNRLGLAQWITADDNPLTARVAVNRYWEQFFGRGIVDTTDDFGAQGERPTHPLLLDYLACRFMRDGWHPKSIQRLIVTSATYRQTSRVAPDLLEADPYNRLLARGPRFRMEAEMLRDNALAISGQLSDKIGGPSVFPPQPPGVWDVPYNDDVWTDSRGPDRYRRGIYTFWRRTAPYPTFINFDAPTREFCTIRRNRTNTPLQALSLLNDPAFVEATQALARRIVREAPDPSSRGRVIYGFGLCVARDPTDSECRALTDLLARESARFNADSKAAKALIGNEPLPAHALPAQVAAWTIVSNVLLNLDETVTKE